MIKKHMMIRHPIPKEKGSKRKASEGGGHFCGELGDMGGRRGGLTGGSKKKKTITRGSACKMELE